MWVSEDRHVCILAFVLVGVVPGGIVDSEMDWAVVGTDRPTNIRHIDLLFVATNNAVL